MKTKSLLLGAFALCLGLFTACGNNGNNKPETPAKLDMTAAQVNPNASGFIFLDQFLTTDPHLTVKVSKTRRAWSPTKPRCVSLMLTLMARPTFTSGLVFRVR